MAQNSPATSSADAFIIAQFLLLGLFVFVGILAGKQAADRVLKVPGATRLTLIPLNRRPAPVLFEMQLRDDCRTGDRKLPEGARRPPGERYADGKPNSVEEMLSLFRRSRLPQSAGVLCRNI